MNDLITPFTKELENQQNEVIENYEKDESIETASEIQGAVFDLIGDIFELINSKDRTPKKKVKPLLKDCQSKLLDLHEKLSDIEGLLVDTYDAQNNTCEAAIERLNAIDSLYNEYKHYKMIHIDEFLDRLDKLIY